MTATEKSSRTGILVLAAMVFALSLAFLFEWRASRSFAARLSSDLSSAVGKLGQEQGVMASRLGGIGSSLTETRETVVAQNAFLFRLEGLLKEPTDEPGTGPGADTIRTGPLPVEQGPSFDAKDLAGLPPLPEGLNPESCLGDEHLADLVTRYRRDPERRLVGLDLYNAMNILSETRARVEVLKSRISLEKAQAAQKLLERGDYVDYTPGERYYTEPGLITFGHDLGERGMRMFYLYREEFPEIYTMKEERARAAEIGIRRFLQVLNGPGGPARAGGGQ